MTMDIGRDVSARSEFLRKGYRGTPVIVIGGETIVGFDRARLDGALARLSSPAERNPVEIVW
ncbi:hypothetical protein D3C87_1845060 [compost metagenome]